MKHYEGHPLLRDLPWYVKLLTYFGTIILLTKVCFTITVYYDLHPVFAMLAVVVGSLSMLRLLGPDKSYRL